MIKANKNTQTINHSEQDIILCDYQKRDYQLPEPQKPDYLFLHQNGVEK